MTPDACIAVRMSIAWEISMNAPSGLAGRPRGAVPGKGRPARMRRRAGRPSQNGRPGVLRDSLLFFDLMRRCTEQVPRDGITHQT